MRFATYAGVSFAVATFAVFHAWSTRIQFYPTVVFLTTNKLAQIALGNWALVMALAMGKLIRAIFLGTLRDIEVEVMYENARFAITETCLALTVFRSDISAGTMAGFAGLLFVKAFHWLSQARVEHLEQAGPQRLTSMVRLASLVFLNLVVDVSMVKFCLPDKIFDEPSVLILFAFEFAILSVVSTSTLVKFLLHVIDANMAGAWHGKTTWTMLLEFFSEVFRFTFFMVFFMVMFTIYSVPPLHLVRDIYLSFQQIQRRLQAFYRYQQLATTMDQRFPDATEAELQECDKTCIICRDAMEAGKKLPCSHIFHFQCLRLWLQQQQACPTCRANIPAEGTAAAAPAAEERARVAAEQEVQAAQPAAGDGAPVDAMQGVPPVAVGLAGQGGLRGGVGNQGFMEGDLPTGGVGADRVVAAAVGVPLVDMPRAADGIPGVGGGVGAPAPNAEGVGFGAIGGAEDWGGGGTAEGFVFCGFEFGARVDVGSVTPPGMSVYAVIVDAAEGTAVRKHVEKDSPTLRTEPEGAVLLLIGPQSPCGSYCVYGGWVGGPGREADVRLVDIAQGQPPSSDDRVVLTGVPVPPPGVGAAAGGSGESAETIESQRGAPDPASEGGIAGGDGLRRREAGGGGNHP